MNSDLKVTFLTREYPPYIYGGAGVHLDYLSRALHKLIEVEVRAFGDQQGLINGVRVKGYQPWPVLAQDSDPRYQKVLDPLSVNLAMVKDRFDAQLVHAHTWYTFMAGLLAKKLYSIPLVTTIHSMEPLRPWKEEQLGNGYMVSSWMEKSGLEYADKVVAVSTEMKQDILKYFDLEPERVEIIYNGIDLEQYRYTDSTCSLEQYGVDLKRPYVLFVGRISRQKGIIHLLNAIKDIEAEAQVVLCAGAPDTKEIAREMTEKVETIRQKRDGVIWIEQMLPREAVIELYSHASVFVCPSLYEPFGIINLEAMACKTAVVATAVGGIKEVVVDGETGFLVQFEQHDHATAEPVDPAGFSRMLAEKINTILGDQKLREKMANNGRKRVERFFSWDSIAQQTLELYESLLV